MVNLVDYFAVELAEIPRTGGRVASILNEPRQQLISAELLSQDKRGGTHGIVEVQELPKMWG